MLKKEVRQWVKYLVEGRKSFKVVFANGLVEVVEYKGYCWVLCGKAYDDNELVEKMVRFQNNEKKFIIKFEEIEEVAEEVAVEESLVEEVENLTSDLFDESDIAYAEEAIERESITTDLNRLCEVKVNVDYEVYSYGITDKQVKHLIDGLVFLSLDFNEFNVFEIDGTTVRVFPYWDIYNNLIINVGL